MVLINELAILRASDVAMSRGTRAAALKSIDMFNIYSAYHSFAIELSTRDEVVDVFKDLHMRRLKRN